MEVDAWQVETHVTFVQGQSSKSWPWTHPGQMNKCVIFMSLWQFMIPYLIVLRWGHKNALLRFCWIVWIFWLVWNEVERWKCLFTHCSMSLTLFICLPQNPPFQKLHTRDTIYDTITNWYGNFIKFHKNIDKIVAYWNRNNKTTRNTQEIKPCEVLDPSSRVIDP